MTIYAAQRVPGGWRKNSGAPLVDGDIVIFGHEAVVVNENDCDPDPCPGGRAWGLPSAEGGWYPLFEKLTPS